MPDYYAQVRGHYSAATKWSFGVHISSAQDLATILTTWKTAWEAAWIDGAHGLNVLYPATTGIEQYAMYLLDANYRSTQVAVSPSVKVGTAVGDSLPWQEAILVSLRSIASGPQGRGRMYLPAIVETSVNNNVLDPGDATRISAAVNAVKTAVQADGSSWFVAKRGVPGHVPPILPGPRFFITTAEVSNKPARQSRRVRKIRPVYT